MKTALDALNRDIWEDFSGKAKQHEVNLKKTKPV